jgi:septal ring-binding cell division protein DamX|tara:strand:- start:597 stop:1430 length:834 start_codon:yes stop_codon:yes gene_type:complete
MIRKIYFIGIVVLAFSCSKENPVGYVGQPVSVRIDIPDESEDLEFLWELSSIPSNSYLINTDIQAGEDNFSVMFIPDVVGTYSIEASVFQYNDEIETQSFTFSITDALQLDTSSISESDQTTLDTLALVELLANDENEESWYDSYNADENLYYPSDTLSSKQYEKEKPKLPTKVPPKKASIKKKRLKGQAIPFDKNRFTIQIASKRRLGDAKKVAAKLIESGYDAYIQKANFKESSETWFRVRVGSYDNRQTASAVAESLSKTQKETAWVDFVRYEN